MYKRVIWATVLLVLINSSLSAPPELDWVGSKQWQFRQGEVFGRILKAPHESPYGRYYIVSRGGLSLPLNIWYMFDESMTSSRRFLATTPSPLSQVSYTVSFILSCYTAPYCKKNGAVMVACIENNALSLWDTTKIENIRKRKPVVTGTLSSRIQQPYSIILPYITKDLRSIVLFGGNTPGQIFDIPDDNNNYSAYDFTSPPTLLTGTAFSVMDMYVLVDENIAACVTDKGMLRIIDMSLIAGSGTGAQRTPIRIETKAVLTAIKRSTSVFNRYLIGQATGAASVRFYSISQYENRLISSIPMAKGLQVIVGGITSLQEQAAFLVITIDDSDYFTNLGKDNSFRTIDTSSEIQLLVTIRPDSMEYLPVNNLLGLNGNDSPLDIFSDNPNQLLILTKNTIQLHTINYIMEGCHETCRTCFTVGPEQCSSCQDGLIKDDSWMSSTTATRGRCVKDTRLKCEGELVSNCLECLEEKIYCKKCKPTFLLMTINGEQKCKAKRNSSWVTSLSIIFSLGMATLLLV